MRPLLLVMRPLGDFFEQGRSAHRPDRELLDRELPVLHLPQHVLRHPVGGLLGVAAASGHSLEIIGKRLALGDDHRRVVVGELMFAPEPRPFGGGKLAERLADASFRSSLTVTGTRSGSGK